MSSKANDNTDVQHSLGSHVASSKAMPSFSQHLSVALQKSACTVGAWDCG